MSYVVFNTDKINIFIFVIDKSSSMSGSESDMVKGLKLFKESFVGFSESDSIAVSVCKFSDNFYPGRFVKVEDIDTSYSADGCTALYHSIVEGAKYVNKYVDEVIREYKIVPRVTFVLFSDGEPFNDKRSRSEAVQAIQNLNNAGTTTVFVAFGSAINSNFGKSLGFMATIDVINRETLSQFFGVDLSRSCQEQSRSYAALGSNFFSQAADKSSSNAYSAITNQALEDTSWLDEI